MFWWLCGVGECGFRHMIVAICVWVWEDLGAKKDEVWFVIFVWDLWLGWDGMWYDGRWGIVSGVGKGEGKDELCLDEWCLSDGTDVYVCFNVWWLVGWWGTPVVFSGRCWDLVQVEEWFREAGRVYCAAVVLKVGWVYCLSVVSKIGWVYCLAVVDIFL